MWPDAGLCRRGGAGGPHPTSDVQETGRPSPAAVGHGPGPQDSRGSTCPPPDSLLLVPRPERALHVSSGLPLGCLTGLHMPAVCGPWGPQAGASLLCPCSGRDWPSQVLQCRWAQAGPQCQGHEASSGWQHGASSGHAVTGMVMACDSSLGPGHPPVLEECGAQTDGRAGPATEGSGGRALRRKQTAQRRVSPSAGPALCLARTPGPDAWPGHLPSAASRESSPPPPPVGRHPHPMLPSSPSPTGDTAASG